MKKLLALCILLTSAICAFAQQSTVTLDEGIKNAMNYLAERLPKGDKVVVLNFSAASKELSDYVIEELTAYIVNNGNLTVVDRRNLELLQQELDFQMSGEVNEDTAQEIGRKLGAQTIISGSISQLGNTYRMRIQAILVETAQIQGVSTETVSLDTTLAALLGVPSTESVSSTPTPLVTPAPQLIDPNAYQDFTTGRRIGAGFLNWIYGLGSFTMGDWLGGLIIGGAGATGVVLALTSADTATLGGILALGAIIYGHIRPFQYHRPRPKVAMFNDSTGLNITFPIDHDGRLNQVQVSFTMSF
jgi:TolB-like protein